jgi:hypothetical protein
MGLSHLLKLIRSAMHCQRKAALSLVQVMNFQRMMSFKVGLVEYLDSSNTGMAKASFNS